MLTACGIETSALFLISGIIAGVATVLTACGIETGKTWRLAYQILIVATVLTACGIETANVTVADDKHIVSCNSAYRLRY